MRSLKEITTIECAVSICTQPNMKEMFIKRESDSDFYDQNKRSKWAEEVKNATLALLKDTSLPFEIQENIYNLVTLILMKMKHWANYNDHIFEVEIIYSRNVIRKSLFNQIGQIDYLAAVNELIKNVNIKPCLRMKLVFTFKFNNDNTQFSSEFPSDLKDYLFVNCTPLNTEELYTTKMVSACQNYLNNIMSKKKYFKEVLNYSLLTGNYIMYKHFDESLIKKIKQKTFQDLLKSVAQKVSVRKLNYERMWVPKDFYVNLFLVMFEKLSDKDKRDRFSKINPGYCYSALLGLLDWPYQIHFIQYANLMWNILKLGDFCKLLTNVTQFLSTSEGRVYNYSSIFQQFWDSAPESYKFFVCREDTRHSIIAILLDYARVDPFTHFDRHNVRLIFQSIRKFQEPSAFLSLLKEISVTLIRMKRYNIADIYLECSLLPENIKRLKYELIYSDKIKNIIKFLIYTNLNEVKDLINWCLSSEKDINDFINSFCIIEVRNELLNLFRIL